MQPPPPVTHSSPQQYEPAGSGPRSAPPARPEPPAFLTPNPPQPVAPPARLEQPSEQPRTVQPGPAAPPISTAYSSIKPAAPEDWLDQIVLGEIEDEPVNNKKEQDKRTTALPGAQPEIKTLTGAASSAPASPEQVPITAAAPASIIANTPTKLSSGHQIDNEQQARSRWQAEEANLFSGAEIPGYSKKERFQVRMSIVNRSTQMLAYPVLMYFTEMEIVRASRYNRTFSLLVVQVGTKATDSDSSVEPLDGDGLSVLGTKIMDIKRSPDVLGHFDPNGLAILLPETERASADRLAHRIGNLIKAIEPSEWTRWKPLQYMIGIATAPDDAVSLPQIVNEVFKYQIRYLIND